MFATESSEIICPYCGEAIVIVIDCSVPEQEYVEDCEVCCRPIILSITVQDSGLPDVTVRHENDA